MFLLTNIVSATYNIKKRSKAAAGKSYTIKWMFGIPEVLDKIRKCKIDEGSEITVIQNSGRDLIIRSGEKRIAMSSDAATRIQV